MNVNTSKGRKKDAYLLMLEHMLPSHVYAVSHTHNVRDYFLRGNFILCPSFTVLSTHICSKLFEKITHNLIYVVHITKHVYVGIYLELFSQSLKNGGLVSLEPASAQQKTLVKTNINSKRDYILNLFQKKPNKSITLLIVLPLIHRNNCDIMVQDLFLSTIWCPAAPTPRINNVNKNN